MHKVVNTILEKEVSRKEFLSLVGAGILSIVGLTSLLKNLENSFGARNVSNKTINYGDDVYGGSANQSNRLLDG